MKVSFLCPYRSELRAYLETFGDQVSQTSDPIDRAYVQHHGFDFIVSYGYQHIIGADVLEHLNGRAVNLHISFLPWNRGSHPNVWSFIEDTPKGVSIHYIDAGIDTGDIIAQREVAFTGIETLVTSYERLGDEVEALFREVWPAIREGTAARYKQQNAGSYHRKKDLDRVAHLLTEGWDTPVAKLSKAAVPKSRRAD